MKTWTGVHPELHMTPRVQLPKSVVVCPCGLHYMVRGQQVWSSYCERLKERG